MGLVEGLGDLVEEQYAQIRTELKIAIADSGYTMGQVATLADVSERALRNALNGTTAPQIDTLLRVAFIIGARIEIVRSVEERARPFQVVPLATGSRRSSASSAASNLRARGASAKKKTARKQGKQIARKSARTSWYEHVVAVQPDQGEKAA